jgi:hypothetical protein
MKKSTHSSNHTGSSSRASSHPKGLGSSGEDDEVNRGNLLPELNDTTSEISFVLERNGGGNTETNQNNGAPKIGLFSLALVMCVCCFSSFFHVNGVSDPN